MFDDALGLKLQPLSMVHQSEVGEEARCYNFMFNLVQCVVEVFVGSSDDFLYKSFREADVVGIVLV